MQVLLLLLLLAGFLCGSCDGAAGPIITTIAGTGVYGSAGDGGRATAAQLNAPTALAYDPGTDRLYVCDYNNYRVRIIHLSNGTIGAFAGNGVSGSGGAGDGGPAVAAMFRSPSAVAIGLNGLVYIADIYDFRVRVVYANGTVDTFAGGGALTTSGIPARSAWLKSPSGLAVDSLGNVYIADSGNFTVGVVRPDGILTLFAGTGGVDFGPDGRNATASSVYAVYGLAVDPLGNVLLAEYVHCRVRNVSRDDGVIRTIVGSPSAPNCGFADGGHAEARLSRPFGVASDRVSGRVYVGDTMNSRVRALWPNGTVTTVAGNGTVAPGADGVPAVATGLGTPAGVAVGRNGTLYFADQNFHRVHAVDFGASAPSGTTGTTGTGTSSTGTSSTGTTTTGTSPPVIYAALFFH
eukprot:TRINITY_DN4092_c0_g1_i1.p1 TRINITY_DN4092_c0_g1~~TRINITY_DN4092_c0_g1_i1.p1  ORF type:complete len:407 (-),score=104.43 TRINITY_DN4092_c0_g1_i1:39-1259(-)